MQSFIFRIKLHFWRHSFHLLNAFEIFLKNKSDIIFFPVVKNTNRLGPQKEFGIHLEHALLLANPVAANRAFF
jgi:hypothetical protein